MRSVVAVIALVTMVAAGCGTDTGSTTTLAPDDVATTQADGPGPAPGDGTAPGDGSAPGDGDEVLDVVATTTILGDVVRQLGGDAVEVEVIIGPGIDPHDFQPSAAQAARLRDADLVVANGLGLEGGLVAMIEAAEDDGATMLELAGLVDPIPFAGDHGDDDDHGDDADHVEDEDHADDDGHTEDDDHAHGDEDPHFWQDPVRMADAVDLIAAALSEIDSGRPATEWEAAAEAYRTEILEVHAANETLLATIPPDRRKMVTNHEAFGYFADRYDFVIIGTVIPGGGTLAEPSAAEFSALIGEIREEGVQAIFVENTDVGRLADVLAGELGEQIGVFELFSDSLGEPGSGADTYLGLIAANAAIVADALT